MTSSEGEFQLAASTSAYQASRCSPVQETAGRLITMPISSVAMSCSRVTDESYHVTHRERELQRGALSTAGHHPWPNRLLVSGNRASRGAETLSRSTQYLAIDG
jgi:hypothetical protein